jgi:hypothetical protein
MRAGSYLLAGLALGALSFNPALARRHGHAGHYSSYHRAERGVQKGADSSTVVAPDVKDGQRTGDVDKSSDKSQDSDAHRGPNKLDKAGVSPKDHASEPEAQPSIDTRITVHQGREPLKGPHLRQFGQFKGEQSRFADAPGAKRDHGRGSDNDRRHREASDKRPLEERRNAFGARIETRAPPAEVRNAAGLAVPPPVRPDLNATAPAGVGRIAGVDPKSVEQDKVAPTHPNAVISPPTTFSRGDSIGGTALIRPATRTGMIAGPAKIAGVISGNNVRVRRP